MSFSIVLVDISLLEFHFTECFFRAKSRLDVFICIFLGYLFDVEGPYKYCHFSIVIKTDAEWKYHRLNIKSTKLALAPVKFVTYSYESC